MDVAVWLHSLGMERYEPVFRENAIYHELGDNLMPYPLGNIHPRLWSWYMGASNFTGALGDLRARSRRRCASTCIRADSGISATHTAWNCFGSLVI
ncbi:hypothetical protein QFZ97_008006 [Paraburkholderia youngii]